MKPVDDQKLGSSEITLFPVTLTETTGRVGPEPNDELAKEIVAKTRKIVVVFCIHCILENIQNKVSMATVKTLKQI